MEALLACSDFQRRRVLQASKQAVQAPHTGSAQLSVPQSPVSPQLQRLAPSMLLRQTAQSMLCVRNRVSLCAQRYHAWRR